MFCFVKEVFQICILFSCVYLFAVNFICYELDILLDGNVTTNSLLNFTYEQIFENYFLEQDFSNSYLNLMLDISI